MSFVSSRPEAKPRGTTVVQLLCDVVVFRRAHAPAIHAASHVDHIKFSICLHAFGSLPVVMVLRLAAL